MAETTLTIFKHEGLEFWIDRNTGRAYATLAAITRMFPKAPKATLRRRLKGVSVSGAGKAEIQTTGGVKGVSHYSSHTVLD